MNSWRLSPSILGFLIFNSPAILASPDNLMFFENTLQGPAVESEATSPPAKATAESLFGDLHRERIEQLISDFETAVASYADEANGAAMLKDFQNLHGLIEQITQFDTPEVNKFLISKIGYFNEEYYSQEKFRGGSYLDTKSGRLVNSDHANLLGPRAINQEVQRALFNRMSLNRSKEEIQALFERYSDLQLKYKESVYKYEAMSSIVSLLAGADDFAIDRFLSKAVSQIPSAPFQDIHWGDDYYSMTQYERSVYVDAWISAEYANQKGPVTLANQIRETIKTRDEKSLKILRLKFKDSAPQVENILKSINELSKNFGEASAIEEITYKIQTLGGPMILRSDFETGVTTLYSTDESGKAQPNRPTYLFNAYTGKFELQGK